MIKEVGSGTHGTVYKVLDNTKDYVPVAMKVVKKAKLGKMSAVLMREIEALKGLHHPNIVELYEVINDCNSPKIFMIMKYLTGPALNELPALPTLF